MNNGEIPMLWMYAKELWGSTFDLPSDDRAVQVKLAVWQDTLGDLDADLLRRTMVGMASHHFAPTAGELREGALKRARIESGENHRLTFDQAAAELLSVIRMVGWVQPALAREKLEAIEPGLVEFVEGWSGKPWVYEDGSPSGAWAHICQDTPDALSGTMRAQWRDVYKLVADRLDQGERIDAPAIARYRERLREIHDRIPELEGSDE